MIDPLDYYADIGAALFPMLPGSKSPVGIVGSFKHDHSKSPEQWTQWRADHPNCNMGIVAFASRLVIVDIDTSDDRDEAWRIWCELCASWGLPGPLMPQVNSARGGWHVLCSVPDGIDASTLRQPDAIKGRINIRCRGYTVAAGSTFEGKPYTLISDAPPHPAPAALLEHCTAKPRSTTPVKVGKHDYEQVRQLYAWMAERGGFADYEDWLQAGFVARVEFGDGGFDLWETTFDGTVTPDTAAAKWESFASEATGNSVTLLSLIARARSMGWSGNIAQSAAAMFADIPSVPSPSIAPPATTREFLLSSAAFVRGFVAPDYVLDGVLQKGFLYAVTAKTGVGKTAVAMLIGAHISEGRPLGDLDVAKGPVIYFAGENPIDIRMRWLGLTQRMRINPETANMYFIDGVVPLSQVSQLIADEVRNKGLAPQAVFVDTAAAFNEGDEENSNNQAGDYARRLRALTTLPGNPCVIVLAHPAKNAGDEDLIPRGGGAFLNEIDGNIALRKLDSLVTAANFGKFRGAEFAPLSFELITVREHPKLRDTRGRHIPTVVAAAISAGDKSRLESAGRADEDAVLRLLCDRPGQTPTDVARAMGWHLRPVNGKEPPINHVKAKRLLDRMRNEKLVEERRGCWFASERAQRDLNRSEQVQK